MEYEVHSDHGTVLRPDQAAFVVNADGSYSILLPDLPEGAKYPPQQMLVVALAPRIQDEELMEVLCSLHAPHQAN